MLFSHSDEKKNQSIEHRRSDDDEGEDAEANALGMSRMIYDE